MGSGTLKIDSHIRNRIRCDSKNPSTNLLSAQLAKGRSLSQFARRSKELMWAASLPSPACKFHPVPPDDFPPPSKPSARFAVSRSTWIVRTESNVRKEEKRRPQPSCVVCRGSGRVDCRYCCGKGRTNCVEQIMLPKGEWPKWCRICGGSGLDYCSRCLGTGEYRDIMGFHFMKTDSKYGRQSPTE